ncbi:MAG: T9SS type A sorting domain-containing protein [Flavobacteriales bacterium]|nr:T9SS type A sorting domain-containing protein [Flavobacteriales bacterium]
MKIDSVGAVQWENTIGGDWFDELHSIQQTSDGGYILGGFSNSNLAGDKTEINLGNDDYWVVKLDTAGMIQWQNTIGGVSEDELHSIQQTSDGGYILGGYSFSNISGDKTENSQGSADYWVLKLDTSGAIQWQNSIGGSSGDVLESIEQTNDGGYIMGGISSSNISGDKTENSRGFNDYWVVQLDSAGTVQWEKTIGASSDDFFRAIQQTGDGGYIMGGLSGSNISGDKTENSQGGSDYWVVKLCAIDTTNTAQSICAGDSVQIFGMYQTVAGIYYDSLTNMNGCDSVLSITLTVNPTYNITDLAIVICNGDSVSIYGTFRNVAGAYYDSSLTTNGCDSIHSKVLTVNPTYNITDPAIVICNGDSVSIYGIFRSTTATYYDSSITINGCDSIHATVLTVNPTYNITDLAIAICDGDTVSIYGTFRSIAGTYYDSLTTINGCDSVHSTMLTINPLPSNPVITPIGPTNFCSGENVLLITNNVSGNIWSTGDTTQFITVSTIGSYTITFTDSNGCSAASTPTAITVNPLYNISDPAVAICNGDSISIYGTFRSLTATYYDSSLTTNGCDSIHSTFLTVNQTYNIIDPAVDICNGDSVSIYGAFRGIAGTYYDSSTTNGCDSIHSTILIVNTTHKITDSAISICNGDSISIYGIFRSSSAIYYDSLTTINGCDSVHSTMLTLNPLPTPVIIPTGPTDFCQGENVILFTNPASAYLWSTSDTTQFVTVSIGGSYTVAVTDSNGCNGTSAPLVVTVNPAYIINDPAVAICNGDSIAIYGTFRSLAATYYDSSITSNGCDSIHSTILTADPLPIVNLGADTVICNGCSINLDAGAGFTSYDWSTGETTQTINVDSAGTYIVTVTDANSCIGGGAIEVDIALGIAVTNMQHAVKIYPNPNTGEFTLELILTNGQDMELSIVNILGKLVYFEKLPAFEGTHFKQIDLSTYSSGVYNLQLVSSTGTINKRVIIE